MTFVTLHHAFSHWHIHKNPNGFFSTLSIAQIWSNARWSPMNGTGKMSQPNEWTNERTKWTNVRRNEWNKAKEKKANARTPKRYLYFSHIVCSVCHFPLLFNCILAAVGEKHKGKKASNFSVTIKRMSMDGREKEALYVWWSTNGLHFVNLFIRRFAAWILRYVRLHCYRNSHFSASSYFCLPFDLYLHARQPSKKMPGLFASLDSNNEERWLYFIRFVGSFPHIPNAKFQIKYHLYDCTHTTSTELIHVHVLRLSKITNSNRRRNSWGCKSD